jgi:hypothetical protein
VGENAYGLSAVTFTLGPDGTATSVVNENRDDRVVNGAIQSTGDGRFERVAAPASGS